MCVQLPFEYSRVSVCQLIRSERRSGRYVWQCLALPYGVIQVPSDSEDERDGAPSNLKTTVQWLTMDEARGFYMLLFKHQLPYISDAQLKYELDDLTDGLQRLANKLPFDGNTRYRVRVTTSETPWANEMVALGESKEKIEVKILMQKRKRAYDADACNSPTPKNFRVAPK